ATATVMALAATEAAGSATAQITATDAAPSRLAGEPSATATDLPLPTALPRFAAVLLPTPTLHGVAEQKLLGGCRVREDWLDYQVQPGDTLFALALQSETSLIELREGNCFTYVRGLLPAENIRLPRLPLLPAPPTPLPVADRDFAARGCNVRAAAFVNLAPLSELAGIVAVNGSADAPPGGSYRLSIKPSGHSDFALYLESGQAKQDEVLGLLNTEIFGGGLHNLRLEVLDAEGEPINAGFCEISLVFQAP
ncbi:MAG: LysM peptidoglycan-binding domain-containing protein, partial [Chloroflexi bacterium]|nr:LysM peptidoglycan-binding domain-containing protein [Chloroflexota bacterium]